MSDNLIIVLVVRTTNMNEKNWTVSVGGIELGRVVARTGYEAMNLAEVMASGKTGDIAVECEEPTNVPVDDELSIYW